MADELLVIGLSHHTAPVDLRERLAVPETALAEELQYLVREGALREAVLVSTCNRVELYGRTEDPVTSARAVREHLTRRATPTTLDPHLYERWGDEAVHHAFRVTSSLDSLVVGEPQILGQVKHAVETATATGALGTLLGRCFTHAFAVAKRVRTETGIAKGSVSVSSIATDLARKIFGDLGGRQVLLVGAGKMGEAAARTLSKSGARLHVLNRSPERAVSLAEACGGEHRPYETLAHELTHADVVITSTGSERFIISHELMRDVMRARRHRPLFLIDIAVPRDVDPRAGELDGLFLYDVDDLSQVAEENLAARRKEANRAEALVEGEVRVFGEWLRSLEVKPTIVALRGHVQSLMKAELERTLGKLSGLSESDRRSLERMCDAMTNKILHAPTAQLRQLGDGPDGRALVHAARRLFELEREAPGVDAEERPSPVGDLAPAAGQGGDRS